MKDRIIESGWRPLLSLPPHGAVWVDRAWISYVGRGGAQWLRVQDPFNLSWGSAQHFLGHRLSSNSSLKWSLQWLNLSLPTSPKSVATLGDEGEPNLLASKFSSGWSVLKVWASSLAPSWNLVPWRRRSLQGSWTLMRVMKKALVSMSGMLSGYQCNCAGEFDKDSPPLFSPAPSSNAVQAKAVHAGGGEDCEQGQLRNTTATTEEAWNNKTLGPSGV